MFPSCRWGNPSSGHWGQSNPEERLNTKTYTGPESLLKWKLQKINIWTLDHWGKVVILGRHTQDRDRDVSCVIGKTPSLTQAGNDTFGVVYVPDLGFRL